MTTTEPPDWAKGFTPGIKAFPGGNLLKSLPMSPTQIKAFVQFLITAIIAQIAIAFGGIEIAGWQPFEFLVEWGQDLQAQASEAYSQSVSAQATANTANSNATTALGFLSSLLAGIPGASTFTDVAEKIMSSFDNFGSLFSGFSVGGIGGLLSDLLGTKSTANTANSNATTSLGNWTSWLTGGSWANIGASVADFLGTKSTANTANTNANTALGNFASILSSLGLGSIGALIADLAGTKSTANTAASNASTALASAATAVTNVGNAFNAIVGGILGGSPTGQTATDAQTALAALNGRVNTLAGGGVLTQYTGNGTWNKPVNGTDGQPFTADELFTIICINGGQGGENGTSSKWDSFKGGRSGGYVSRRVAYSDLASSYAMTIGTGGSTGAGAGGTTSFGTLVVGVSGVGGEFREDGSYAVVTPPGDGGDGGSFNSGNIGVASMRGKASAFAAGGITATSGTSGAGGAAPAGVPSGGGGGGGGGLTSSTNAAGGAGGFPGGGGGGGSLRGTTTQDGGAGAAGCIYVIAPH